MALKVADNFSYKGRKPLDERLVVDTLPDLLALASSIIYDGIIVYVKQEFKFYTYDSNNTVDPQLQLWRELKTAGDLISNCTVDTTPTSATYGHLFIQLDNGQNIDCGNVIGPKGDQGEGFAIAKEYASVSDMTSDSSPVDDGKMVAVIYTDPVTTKLVADIYIRNSNELGGTGKNEPGYTYFCNLADATTIQGPQGIQGPKGDKGDAPVITLTPIPATLTSPAGTKVTITIGTDPATQTTVDYSVYNGKDGVGIDNIALNAQNHLIITMTDASTYDLGVIGSGAGGGCITILGCFNQAPTTFAQGDIYYNTTDNKLYKATSSTAWDTGSTPVEDILYISIDDKMIYAYTQHTWTIYGGTGVSQEPNNAIQQKTDGLYVKDSATLVQNLVTKKYANTTPKYLFASKFDPAHPQPNIPANTSWLDYLTDINTTLKLTNDNWIILTEGTWLLEADTITGSTSGGTGPAAFYFTDRNQNQLSSLGYSPRGVTSDYDVTARGVVTVKPGDTLEVTVVFDTIHSIEAAYSNVMVHEISGLVGDPLQHIDLTQGIQDAPVGHIINYMGTTAPQHYLVCDGSEYNISDYPDLVAHFIKEFGQANEFGGDGINTFAVPDLSGEFLRGAGTNNHTNQGNGANVGEHQDGTEHIAALAGSANQLTPIAPSVNEASTNVDTELARRYVYLGTTNKYTAGTFQYKYTSRPTNTSVLYCIKYEPTYFIGKIEGTTVIEDLGSIELSGTDTTAGAHIYTPEKTIALTKSIEGFDTLEIVTYNAYLDGTRRFNNTDIIRVKDINYVTPGSADGLDDTYLTGIQFFNPENKCLGYSVYLRFKDANTITINHTTVNTLSCPQIVVKIRGIKTVGTISN